MLSCCLAMNSSYLRVHLNEVILNSALIRPSPHATRCTAFGFSREHRHCKGKLGHESLPSIAKQPPYQKECVSWPTHVQISLNREGVKTGDQSVARNWCWWTLGCAAPPPQRKSEPLPEPLEGSQMKFFRKHAVRRCNYGFLGSLGWGVEWFYMPSRLHVSW